MLCSSLSEQRSETEAALPKAEGPLSCRLGSRECPILGGKLPLQCALVAAIVPLTTQGVLARCFRGHSMRK